jgi:hypothetical protein
MKCAKKINLLIILVILTAGCGVKSAPTPMNSIVPKRIMDLQAIPREGGLLLEWTVPRENADKSPLVDLASFKVLRSEGNLVGDECKGCGEPSKLVYEMILGRKEEIAGKKISIFFEELEPRKVYVYEVIPVNRKGQPGSSSNPVTVYWDYPPHVPQAVRAERGDRRVELSWEAVDGAAGYNIYRRGEVEEYPVQPMNASALTVIQYTDLKVQNEKRYIYSVRALRKVAKTYVEGKGSLGIPVTPTDLIPPNPPEQLVAIPTQNGIELNWRKNREPDLLGYYIYRRAQGESGFRRLNDVPLAKEDYLDSDVKLGQDYEYAVSAVDNSVRKNESPRSEEVKVTYRYR